MLSEDAQAPIRVVVAEDSYLIRDALTATLASAALVELVAVCCNAGELETAIVNWHPDVVLIDLRMPASGAAEGIRVAARLRATNPELGVVALSQYAEPAYALALLDMGSGRRAYLLTERIRNRAELIAAIEAVAHGESVVDPMIVEELIEARARGANSRLSQLVPSERRLLAEIAAGKSDGAIAESLVNTTRTVAKQVRSVFSKLGLPQTEDVSRRVAATLDFLVEEDRALV